MYKMLVLIKRKPGLSHEEFRSYYEGHHAPWGVKLLGTGLRRYVRNYVTDSIGADGPTDGPDVVTEFWWNNREEFDAFMKLREEDPEIGAQIREDEQRFMDIAAAHVLIVEEVEELRPLEESANSSSERE